MAVAPRAPGLKETPEGGGSPGGVARGGVIEAAKSDCPGGCGCPHAGAWISTSAASRRLRPRWSPPTRGRGLNRSAAVRQPEPVSPAGAWIETIWWHSGLKARPVAPTRGRGLKQPRRRGDGRRSPPRGAWIETRLERAVGIGRRPHAGAWVETCHSIHSATSTVAPRGAWLKLPSPASCPPRRRSPPTRGRGLKLGLRVGTRQIQRRPPRGGVD